MSHENEMVFAHLRSTVLRKFRPRVVKHPHGDIRNVKVYVKIILLKSYKFVSGGGGACL